MTTPRRSAVDRQRASSWRAARKSSRPPWTRRSPPPAPSPAARPPHRPPPPRTPGRVRRRERALGRDAVVDRDDRDPGALRRGQAEGLRLAGGPADEPPALDPEQPRAAPDADRDVGAEP